MRNRRAFIPMLAVGPGDTTAPTCILTSSALQLVKAAFTVTATLSEVSADFDADSVTVVNGTASVAGTGPYTITVTPTADGTVTVQVGADGFHDTAGNGNTASNTISRIYLASLNGFFLSDTSLRWQDVGRTTAATADNDPVAVWDNLVTGNNFVRVGADANRPTIQTVSGVKVIRNDASDDRLDFSISADASQTIFILAQKRSAPGAGRIYLYMMGNTTFTGVYTTTGTGTGFIMSGDVPEYHLGGSPTNWNTISVVHTDNANCAARINGGAATSFDPYDAYTSKTTIQLGNNGDYDYIAVIHCTAALADGPRAAVEAYLDSINPT